MIKRALIVILIGLAAGIFALSLLARNAPGYLREALERSLDKSVEIESITFRFPGTFQLEGITLFEKQGPFKGEVSFAADHIQLEVSPFGFSKKALIVDRMEMQGAMVSVRKWRDKFYQPFTGALPIDETEPPVRASAGSEAVNKKIRMPMEIKLLFIRDGAFQFADYDAKEGGFVIAFNHIEAKLMNISLPALEKKTYYSINAEMPQGRDQRTAEAKVSGWTVFKSAQTEALLTVRGVFIPYFRPYYLGVLGAPVEHGYLETRASVRISEKRLTSDIDLEVSELLLQTDDRESLLFGLKPDEVLSFLKDSSGKLKLQCVIDWNMADRSVRLKDVMKKSIEKSLKKTMVGNVGNIIANTLQKIGEAGSVPGKTKETLEDKIKKLQNFLKY